MPFGVATAHQIFMKTLKLAITKAIKRQQLRIFKQADDILLLNCVQQILGHGTMEINDFFSSLEWLIMEDKSTIEPSQEFEFLGWLWRTEEKTFQLMVDTRISILKELGIMMNKNIVETSASTDKVSESLKEQDGKLERVEQHSATDIVIAKGSELEMDDSKDGLGAALKSPQFEK
ncbi:MAG: hypothetical protein EZS28_011343 [Streblomastix strix]|uniref:Reverse transcriptase domain-containing protein n=1 Tax=Streblomastix strix TaxID=222440 RepID=A0A5J4WDR6_9EUKA|nr:MAG: hypothetical protein EZS28_011343 [Streblomastix strix]